MTDEVLRDLIATLRDPVWQGVGAIAGVLAVLLYLYVERQKLLSPPIRRAIAAVIGGGVLGLFLVIPLVMAYFGRLTGARFIRGFVGELAGMCLGGAVGFAVIYLMGQLLLWTPLAPFISGVHDIVNEGEWPIFLSLAVCIATMLWLALVFLPGVGVQLF